MRYLALLLIASIGAACNYLGDWGTSPDTTLHSQVELTAVNVSPTVVHAGDHFTASASATLAHCTVPPQIIIDYGNYAYNGNPPSYAVSLTAVLGDTVVIFEAKCDFLSTPMKTVTIKCSRPSSSRAWR